MGRDRAEPNMGLRTLARWLGTQPLRRCLRRLLAWNVGSQFRPNERWAAARLNAARSTFALGIVLGLELGLLLMPHAERHHLLLVGAVSLVAGMLAGATGWSVCSLLQRCDAARRRRAMRPQCHHCGYSMIGSVSRYCTECGNRYRRGWLGPRRRPRIESGC